MRDFMSKGWDKEKLSHGKWKITMFVNLTFGKNTLLIQSGLIFETGDILSINDIEVRVKFVKHTFDFDRFNWLVKFDCKQMKEFRENLTYYKAVAE